ncbi:MAG TPA: VWA domain-containing protein [Chthoniobacterales bacterium]
MKIFYFVHPWLLAGVPVVLLLVALCYVVARNRRRKRLTLFLTTRQASKAMNWKQEKLRLFSALATGLGLALIFVALARPLIGPKEGVTKASGIDAYVLLDLSNSMRVTDAPPKRLDFVKAAIAKWVGNLGGDRIGLVLIGGDAFVAIPPSISHESFNFTLAQTTFGWTQGGSNLARGIDAAVTDLAANQKEGKYSKAVLLLFSDGGETSGDAVTAARTAWQTHGIRVFTIGVGTREGGRVPGVGGVFRTGVFSKLEEDKLKAIAQAGGGTYTHLIGSSGEEAGEKILHRLYESELRRFSTLSGKMEVEDYDEWFWLPLALAFLCLAAEPFIRSRRRVPSFQEMDTPEVVLPPVHEGEEPARGGGSRLRNRLRQASSLRVLLAGACFVWAHSALAIDQRGMEKLMAEKNYGELEKILSAELKTNRDNLEATYNLGLVRYAQAGAALLEVASKPEGYNRLFRQEKTQFARAKYVEAIDLFQQAAVSPDPKLSALATFQLGNTKVRIGESVADDTVRGAVDAFEEALANYEGLDNTHFAKNGAHNAALAMDLFRKAALQVGQKLDAEAAAVSANNPKRLTDQNAKYGDATSVLDRLLQRKPSDAEATNLRDAIALKWAKNLAEMARPIDQEADKLFAIRSTSDKSKKGPKWLDGIKTRGKAVELLEKANGLAPNDKSIAGQYDTAKGKLVDELLESVKDAIETRAGFHSVLAGVTMRQLEIAEKYAPNDPRVQQARKDLLAAIENAAVITGDKLVKQFDDYQAQPENQPNSHSRMGQLKGSTMDTKAATVLSEGMNYYRKALDINASNPRALEQVSKYGPILADAFSKMGESELTEAKDVLGSAGETAQNQPGQQQSPQERSSAEGGKDQTNQQQGGESTAQATGGEPQTNSQQGGSPQRNSQQGGQQQGSQQPGGAMAALSMNQMKSAIGHLENAANGFSQATGMGLNNESLQAMQGETNDLLAQLRSQYEAAMAQNEGSGQGQSKSQSAQGSGMGPENVGGRVVETYLRTYVRQTAKKGQGRYDTKGGSWVEKDW